MIQNVGEHLVIQNVGELVSQFVMHDDGELTCITVRDTR